VHDMYLKKRKYVEKEENQWIGKYYIQRNHEREN